MSNPLPCKFSSSCLPCFWVLSVAGLMCSVYFQCVTLTGFQFLPATLGAIAQRSLRPSLPVEGTCADLIYFNFHLTDMWPGRYVHGQNVSKLDFRTKIVKLFKSAHSGLVIESTCIFFNYFSVKKYVLKLLPQDDLDILVGGQQRSSSSFTCTENFQMDKACDALI